MIWTATVTGFLKVLQQLLPPGLVWSRSIGTRLSRVLHGTAEELTRVNARTRALIEESIPATSTDGGLLSDWERVVGLPEFGYVAADDDERRTLLTAKLAAQGGQDAPYFLSLAIAAGCDDAEVSDGPLTHVWQVKTPAHVSLLRGGDRPGRPLSFDTAASKRLAMALKKCSPAHTYVWFTD